MSQTYSVIEGKQDADFPIFPDAIPDRPYSITFHSYGKCITPHGPWTSVCTKAFREHDAKGVNLNLWTGWRREELGFLAELQGTTAVHIFTGEKEDLTPLSGVGDSLELLVLQCRPSHMLDMLLLPRLLRFRCNGDSKIGNLDEASQLEELSIHGGPKYRSFDRFRKLKVLRKLEQVRGGIEELGFTFKRPEMRELEVTGCYKFASLDGLEMVPNLRSLEIVSAKKLPSIDAVAELKNLEMLVLDGCGTYESLDPILELKDLQHLSLDGSTTFKRADFMRLLDMPNLRHFICHRKQHYNKEDFEAVHWALLDRRRTNPDSGTSGNTRKETTGR